MPGFDALYRQTITLFNRKEVDGKTYWYPTVLEGVHLVLDQSIIISTYGEQAQDNAMVHIMYQKSGADAIVGGKVYMTPKVFRASGDPTFNITFGYGDNFDFIMSGAYEDISPVDDTMYKHGFFNHMNKLYDEVFAITRVAKFNLIPHFEITAR